MMLRQTVAEISKSSLLKNIDVIKKIHSINGQSRSFLCPMIKANAYGHDDIIVSRIIEPQVSHFGVVLLEEGIKLRSSGIKKPILIFGMLDDSFHFKLCEEYNLTPVISSFDFLNALKKSGIKKIKIHLKFDTGMTRLGFQKDDLIKLKHQLEEPALEVEGICTHFLNSEDARDEKGFTQEQFKSFMAIERQFQGAYQFSHCLNSSALFAELPIKEKYQDSPNHMGARPGLSIYGYVLGVPSFHKLNPVLTLKSTLVQKKKIQKDTTVSYGATWKARRETTVGVVAIGYGDGYFRQLSNQAEMIVRDHAVPLIGRVCMDYTMIDLTDHPMKDQLPIGEQIIVWGGGYSINAQTLAQKVNTIPYELLTHVSSRVPRMEVE